jgi:hypothetical protein
LAVFSFGGLKDDSDIPDGAFLVQGSIDLHGGVLALRPLAWLVRPGGHVMVVA